ncbi:hypothetical protein FSP39_011518 [Pinctada imbricata]|uniref:CEP152 CEP63 binding coiled coil domain-containing protein n=1 Tax=Pinctada imbricata TaxID=66713 RepID=A0AA89C583_PINIB|nr:hypothetical protein FSP39_011518 [Pinctada imbricata]
MSGISMNFDGQELQNLQEKEYEKEEQQQQNELRALLDNAFDDLIDDEDDFSVTSDEGADSRNHSLHFRREESEPIAEEDDGSAPSNLLYNRDTWGRRNFPAPTSTPLGGLPTIAQSPYGSMSSLRQSQESLRASQEIRNSQEGALRRSHEGILESDGYHSNSEQESTTSANPHTHHKHHFLHHHQFQQPDDWSSHDHYLHSQGQHGYSESYQGHQHHHDNTQPDNLHGDHGNYQNYRYDEIPERQEAEGGNTDMHGDQANYLGHYHGYPHHHHHHGYYGNTYNEDQTGADNQTGYSGLPHSKGYQSVQTDQGYHTALGSTVNSDLPSHDYHVTSSQPHSVRSSHDHLSSVRSSHDHSHSVRSSHDQPHSVRSSHDHPHSVRSSHDHPHSVRSSLDHDSVPSHPLSPQKQSEYKVHYQPMKDNSDPDDDDDDDETAGGKRRKTDVDVMAKPDDSTVEGRQMAQLQVLYKARGRKIEDLNNELEICKQESAREIRILKHQLSLAKGERQGVSTNLQQCQELLGECKTENAQLKGKLQAMESQSEALQKGKEEAIKNLQTAESNIETLNQQIAEMGHSESLTRARHEHERVVAGIQQKHDKEVKVLREKMEELQDKLNDGNSENSTLKQKLSESYKEAENAQISRAETINRLTRSLEESQKQCRTLLESASNHEVSQMKIQLQQALASKKITDEMLSSYQDEVKDLKEQLNMFEAASGLGVLSRDNTQETEGIDDSMLDLGIKKTLDFETPESSRTLPRSQATFDATKSHDVITGLKLELERCLLSNKEKRIQVSKLQEDLRSTKKELEEVSTRCERAEVSLKECTSKLKEWEELVRSEDKVSAIEARLMKDINNLKREKQVLMEDTEELKKRLEEVASNEEKLSEINNELNQQISQMVKDYDADKREALERIELKTAHKEVDDVKELYVKVCAEKDSLDEAIRSQLSNDTKKQLQKMKESMEKENFAEIERVKIEAQTETENAKTAIREEVKKEIEEENKKIIENKIAMSKVEWFEEQRASKQAAVDNAIKLTETEWKSKLDSALETEVDNKVEEAKKEWFKQRQQAFSKELESKLKEEKEAWEKSAEVRYKERIKTEKGNWEKGKEEEIKQAVSMEKSNLSARDSCTEGRVKWQQKLEVEIHSAVEKERKEWEEVKEIEILEKIQQQKEKWNKQKENEITERLEEAQNQWEKNLESQLLEGIETEVEARLKTEKENWRSAMESQKSSEIKQAIELARTEWEDTHEFSVDQIRNSMEKQLQERISAEISLALDEAKSTWDKDHEAQIQERLAAENVKEAVYKEEIESLKKDVDRMNQDIKEKEERLHKEKCDLIALKDAEKKHAVKEVEEQSEKDYKQFTADHHDTLTQALKAARDQHNKEKAELERRYAEEIKKLKQTEAHLRESLQNSAPDKVVKDIQDQFEEDRRLWEEENLRLKEEVVERDELLGKADQHLSQEVDRLREELELAYKKQLDKEMTNMKLVLEAQNGQSETSNLESQLMELKREKENFRTELTKVTNENMKVIDEISKVTDESRKVKTQIHRVTEENKNLKEELQKVKDRMFDETKRYVKEIQELKAKLNAQESRLTESHELKTKIVNLNQKLLELNSKEEEIKNLKNELERLKLDNDNMTKEKSKLLDNYGRMEKDLQGIISEKEKIMENLKNMENAYKKDLASQKQKQEDVYSRLVRSEKMLQEAKQYYRSEIEKVRKALEKDTSLSLEAMKNKMIEMSKSHSVAMDSMKQQYEEEIEELREKSLHSSKDLNDTEVQTDSEDNAGSDDSMFEMRDQYLDTVSKIKEDVMAHITETNMRAAETVKCEMTKERNTVLRQLKSIYMDNVRKVLQNEIIGANIEAKLADIEEALNTVSFDKSVSPLSSRSTTPRSDVSGQRAYTPIHGQNDLSSHYSSRSFQDLSSSSQPNNDNYQKPCSESRRSYYEISHTPNGVSRSNGEVKVNPLHRRVQTVERPRSATDIMERSAPREIIRPKSAQENTSRRIIASKNMLIGNNRQNGDVHLKLQPQNKTGMPSMYPSQNNSGYPSNTSNFLLRERQHRSRERSASAKEVTFSADCKKSSPDRVEDRFLDRNSKFHPNITTRKLSPRDHSTSNENSDQETDNLKAVYSRGDVSENSDVEVNSPRNNRVTQLNDSSDHEYHSPRGYRRRQINGNDLLPSKYTVPVKEQDPQKFDAVDPHPIEIKTHREEVLSPNSTLNQSSLYKAKSESELSCDGPSNLTNLLGTYKYTSLRDALGKGTYTSPKKGSSLSTEDLRYSGMPRAYSVDVGLHSLGLDRHSPRKYNPSPEKLQHDAGESPVGTPRMHRKFHSERNCSEDIDRERVRRDIGNSLGMPTQLTQFGLKSKEPVKILVEKFQGLSGKT